MMYDTKSINRIIEKVLSRHSHFYKYKEKQLLKEGQFRELATGQLSKIIRYGWVMPIVLFLTSAASIYYFILFGSSGGLNTLFMGLLYWFMTLFFAYFYSSEFLARKHTMQIVMDLLSSEESQKSLRNKEK